MTTHRLLACSLVMVLLPLALCSCSKNKKKDDGLTSNELRVPEHFKYIPADSPYVMASMKILPYEQLGWDMNGQYVQAIETFKKLSADSLESYGSFEDAPPEARLLTAIVEEFENHKSIEDIKSIGMTTKGHFSIYGIGMFPAARLELGDAQKFEAMIQRVEARVGINMMTKTVDGKTFRYLENDGMTIPIVVTENELLLGLSSTQFSDDFVRYLTGVKKPAKSLYEDNSLIALQEQYGMLPYLTGFADFRGITKALLKQDTTSLIAQSIASTGEPIPDVSEVCKTEYTKLVNDMPRVVMGYTDLTRTSIKATMALEVKSDLNKRLMAMKANSPAYGTEVQKNALMAMTLGFGIDSAIEVLRAEAQRVGSEPYRCENLTWMNESAEDFYFQAQQVPPAFRTLLGMTFVLDAFDVDFKQKKVNNVSVMALMNNSDPQTFFTTMQLFFGDFIGNMDLKPDLQPATMALPADLARELPGLPSPVMVMSNQAIGMSMGNSLQDVTKTHVEKVSSTPSPLVSMTYDMVRLMDILLDVMSTTGASQEEMAAFESMRSSYKEIGPTTLALDIQENGFFMNMDIVMKPSGK